jgi:tetratricopeptide (TPR) repeat protein
MMNLGVLVKKLGQFKQAVQCFEFSINLYEKLKLTDDVQYAETYRYLGQAYNDQGIFSKAL